MPNFFNKYPYTDFHELNLDWLIARMKELQIQFDEFVVVNHITFSGQWDITKQYPAWTIVNDNNIGYVSIQPVPVGVVLTNTDYWAEVIDYSAQIAGMQNRIVALENEDIVINGKINTINNELTEIEAHEIVLLGDSYGVDVSAGGTSWATIVETALSGSNTIYRSTVGGTGFASDYYMSDNNLSMLQSLNISDRDKVKDIVIIGGANDANLLHIGTITESNLTTRIREFMTYCLTNFPNAIVKVAFVGWRNDSEAALKYFIRTAALYQDICNEFKNAKYISDGETVMHNMSFINTVDHIHPVQTASNELGKLAISIINNGDYEFIRNYRNDALTLNAGYSFHGGTVYTNVVYDRDYVEFNALGEVSGGFIDIRTTTPPVSSGGVATYLDIFTIPNFIFGINRNHGYYVTPCIAGTSGGPRDAKALIGYDSKSLSVRLFNINNVTDGTQILNILLPPFSLKYNIRQN